MSRIQFIERAGKREFAILPIELYELVKSQIEALSDEAIYDAAKARDDGFRIPGAVADAILDGTHPVKAWRAYRGLTLAQLAEKAGLTRAYLSQIEAGKRVGAVKTLQAIAVALDVGLGDLTEEG